MDHTLESTLTYAGLSPKRRPVLSGLSESIIILIAAYVISFGPSIRILRHVCEIDYLGSLLVLPIFFAFLVLLMLTCVRLFQSPLIIILSILIVYCGSFVLLFWQISHPSYQELKILQTIYPMWIPVPSYFPIYRQVLELALSFLFGFLFARSFQRIGMLCLGFWLANVFFSVLFYGVRPSWFNLGIWPLLNTTFCLLILVMPSQRRALERLLVPPQGIAAAKDSPPLQRPYLLAVITQCALLFGIIAVCFSVVFGHYERKILRYYLHGSEPILYNIALHNAYDDLKEMYSRNTGRKSDALHLSFMEADEEGSRTIYHEDKIEVIMPAMKPEIFTQGPLSPPLIENTLSALDIEKVERRFSEIQAYFTALETAATADYCFFHELDTPVWPHFNNLREMTRALAMRATIKIGQDRLIEAIQDIETLMNIGWLLKGDGGSLGTYMIGVSIQSSGMMPAHSFYLKNRDNPEALAMLEDLLNRMAPKVRESFNYERLRQTEPGFWPIAPFFEFVAPGFHGASHGVHARWVYFDMLVLCVALEKYRKAYSQYPERLEQLAPEYLPKKLVDPFEGQPYVYQTIGDEFKISCPPLLNTWLAPEKYVMPFPNSAVDHSDMREAIAKFLGEN